MKKVFAKEVSHNNSQKESTKFSRKKKLSAKTAKSFAYKLIDTWVKKN